MRQFDDKQEAYEKLLEDGAKMRQDIGPGGDNQGGVAQKLEDLEKKWNDSKVKAKEKQVGNTEKKSVTGKKVIVY